MNRKFKCIQILVFCLVTFLCGLSYGQVISDCSTAEPTVPVPWVFPSVGTPQPKFVWVGISSHILQDDTGFGGIHQPSETDILDRISAVNQIYSSNETGVQFFSKTITYRLDSYMYNGLFWQDTVIFGNPPCCWSGWWWCNYASWDADPISVNSYTAEVMYGPGTNLVGGIATFPGPNSAVNCSSWGGSGPQLINAIGTNNQAWANKSLEHELGHYFGLYHTFTTTFGAECVDGSNCSIAGDLICDTPASYVGAFSGSPPPCIYTGTQLDPCNSDPYNPDNTNIMETLGSPCRTNFSPTQASIIRGSLESGGLRNDHRHICSGDIFPLINNFFGDGQIDILDLITLINGYNLPGISDLDGDGITGITDLVTLINNFGDCRSNFEDGTIS